MDAFDFASDLPTRWRSFYPKSIRDFIPLSSGFSRAPLVPINFMVKNLQVKIAETSLEKKAAYRLRFEVFHREYKNSSVAFGLDRDRFDDQADLLIIKDLTSSEVVGTYRLICSEISDRFYSATEFDLNRFLPTPGIKVELSRACIREDYRKGLVITLLWRGLYEYLRRVDAKYLFGLSSVTKLSSNQLISMINYFAVNEMIDDRYGILPLAKYDQSAKILRGLGDSKSLEIDAKDLVPALLRAYLNSGAKLATVPAYDADFRCFDFLTILDTAELKSSHSRKLGAHLSE